MIDRPDGPGAGDDDLDIRIAPVDDEFVSRPRPPRPSAPAAPAEPEPPEERHAPPDADVAVADSTAAGPRDARSGVRLYFEAMVVTLVVWLFAQTFLAQPVTVPTGSMLNTIRIGDHLVVNRFIYGSPAWLAPFVPYRPIRRGDIIVFHHPTEPDSLYVKRVIALPGETVEVYGSRVYINSQELPETKVATRDPGTDGALDRTSDPVVAPGATYTVYYSSLRDVGTEEELETLASADGGTVGVGRPFSVPPGQYFCLGDNRDNSQDSRYWGTVPRENVVGRAMFVYWSYGVADGDSAVEPQKHVRPGRIGTLLQ